MKNTPGLNRSVDRLDLSILSALQSDARMSKVQIGAKVGLSASRCYERLKRLEKAGVVRGYHADIDLARLTSVVQFLVQVRLRNYTSERAKQFERTVVKIPEIISCSSILGHVDYMLLIVAANLETYQDVIAGLLHQSSSEFDFTTFAVTNTIKTQAQGDLQHLIGRLTAALDKPSAT